MASPPIIIAGAGMAGLIAGRMLSRHCPSIVEAQPSLPNNHSAVLRFRSSIVGDVLGIPFKKVKMIKTAMPWRNPVADALAYSFKNTGVQRSDRSISAGFVAEDRFIAPPDFIAQLASGLNITYSRPLDFECDPSFDGRPAIISTIPMPALMNALGYQPGGPVIPFKSVPGVNIKARITHTDAYVSLLTPDPSLPFSRLSLTGDELVVECLNVKKIIRPEDVFIQACNLLGFGSAWIVGEIEVSEARYSKILPIDEDARRSFLHWATDNFNIFSLGRFATWRPNLLLDDLVNDIRLIEGWIMKRDRYALAKHR